MKDGIQLFEVLSITVIVYEITETAKVPYPTEDAKLCGKIHCVIDHWSTSKHIDVFLSTTDTHTEAGSCRSGILATVRFIDDYRLEQLDNILKDDVIELGTLLGLDHEILLERFVVDDYHIIEIHHADEIGKGGFDRVCENQRAKICKVLNLALPVNLERGRTNHQAWCCFRSGYRYDSLTCLSQAHFVAIDATFHFKSLGYAFFLIRIRIIFCHNK